MKKYIYGSIAVAVLVACGLFFFHPPVTHDQASTTLALTCRLPEGYAFTAGAPFMLTWRAENP